MEKNISTEEKIKEVARKIFQQMTQIERIFADFVEMGMPRLCSK